MREYWNNGEARESIGRSTFLAKKFPLRFLCFLLLKITWDLGIGIWDFLCGGDWDLGFH